MPRIAILIGTLFALDASMASAQDQPGGGGPRVMPDDQEWRAEAGDFAPSQTWAFAR